MSATRTTPPRAPAGDRRQRVQSAQMGMAVLKALATLGGSASLTAIAGAVGESTAKAHRYVASLLQEGFVTQHPTTQHYQLGAEAIRIGLAAMRQCDPIRLGEPALVRLRESLEVTCFLAVMGNHGPTVLRMEEPPLPVTVNIRGGSVLPVLWSATGRAFLGFSEDGAVGRRAEEEYRQATADQRAQLPVSNPVAQLRSQVRSAGCAIVVDTLLRGISAAAAPIFDARGQISAVLTALGASNGIDVRPGGPVCQAVVREATAISVAMGYAPQPSEDPPAPARKRRR